MGTEFGLVRPGCAPRILSALKNHLIHQKKEIWKLEKGLKAIWNYLKNWKNLFSHAIVGILILVVGLALPILPVYRIGILLLVVALNIFRMRLSEKKEQELEA
jgi:hypothetical protein